MTRNKLAKLCYYGTLIAVFVGFFLSSIMSVMEQNSEHHFCPLDFLCDANGEELKLIRPISTLEEERNRDI